MNILQIGFVVRSGVSALEGGAGIKLTRSVRVTSRFDWPTTTLAAKTL